jgi:hypothetical protein
VHSEPEPSVGAVIGAVGLAAIIWVVAVPLLGHRLVVTGGPSGRETLEIGLAPVAVIALVAALAGWGLLALLERLLPLCARRVWTITAGTVLVLSFGPLLAPGMSSATRITLGALHVAVAAVLIPTMTCIPGRPAPIKRYGMTITLNHTIVPAVDNEHAASFFATIMGLTYAGTVRHFAPVRVNDQLTLDFMTVENPVGLHLAFDVDPATFDQIVARLHADGVPYGSEPDEPDNGRTDHPLCPRGLYFIDDARNLYELISPA